MPKINGKNIDPKVYAKRVTQAKKTVASMDPAVKAKIKEMYPKVTKESIAKKALSPKKATPKVGMQATPKAVTKPAPKKTAPKVGYDKDGFKPSAKPSNSPMSKKLTGEAAAKQYQKEISPKGMASAKAAQSKAIDKKYPGLYKKSK